MDECVILLSLCICEGLLARSLCHLPSTSLLYANVNVNGNKRACVCSNANANANSSVSMSGNECSYFVVAVDIIVVVAWQIYSTRLLFFLSSSERRAHAHTYFGQIILSIHAGVYSTRSIYAAI